MFQIGSGERRYRRQVFAAVDRLFRGMGVGSVGLVQVFPDIGPLVGRLRATGRTPEAVALMVSAPLLSGLVLNGLSEEDRTAVVAAFRGAPAGQPPPQSTAAILAAGIQWMVTEALRWSDLGWISRADVDLVVSELTGAVRGLNPEERALERLYDRLGD